MPEQFIIDVQYSPTALSRDEMRSAIERLATVRHNAMMELSKGAANLSEIEFRHGESQMEARFFGTDESNQVQIAAGIRATSLKFVTMTLYRYTLSEVGVPFAHYSSLIFDLAQVKEA